MDGLRLDTLIMVEPNHLRANECREILERQGWNILQVDSITGAVIRLSDSLNEEINARIRAILVSDRLFYDIEKKNASERRDFQNAMVQLGRAPYQVVLLSRQLLQKLRFTGKERNLI